MPIPLYYTFGNHQHWVDLQWLWGYHVMPGSIQDMLELCREAGVKGCVNFDGIGYEKLAAEDPEVFDQLRQAVRSGQFEIVGGSYGQPYGLFHGSESNVRQRVFGQRAVRRLFGVPAKTFWEEEFDFSPQLPQILRGVGVEYASLFFQWTWHTPEVPKEEVPVVRWEAPDGSSLLTATRNKLNLHQWPEDMELTFAGLATQEQALAGAPTPLILQWLELMPTPDWMCRTEVILPKLKELLADPRFEVTPVTLGEYLEREAAHNAQIPVRRYTMDQIWHGMTLGKNGDNMRRLSREVESSLLAAETAAATAGLFGRPYAQWDVYPTWELEEAWRELLSAQHHDNDECEGLCGYVGRFSYERSLKLSRHVLGANTKALLTHSYPQAKGVTFMGGVLRVMDGYLEENGSLERPEVFVVNPLGWPRTAVVRAFKGGAVETINVPAFGTAHVKVDRACQSEPMTHPPTDRLERDGLVVDANLQAATLSQIVSPHFPEGMLGAGGALELGLGNARETFRSSNPRFFGWRCLNGATDISVQGHLDHIRRALAIAMSGEIVRPPAGLNASFQTAFHLSFRPRIISDQPYSVMEVLPVEKGLKKYPTGDWMTSPQWFEEVHRAFSSLTLVDLVDADNPDRGLLICHDGSQQWFLDEDARGVRVVLSAYDPWDEDYFQNRVDARFILMPHGPMRNSERWKIAQEFMRPVHRAYFSAVEVNSEMASFSPVSCDADNVALTAFYRETRDSAKGQKLHAADVLGIDYPYVIRMVELDGLETEAKLHFGTEVAKALKTNLLGEPEQSLDVSEGRVTAVALRPYEIATIYLDLVDGRKRWRDLDAKREIWATVHRVDG